MKRPITQLKERRRKLDLEIKSINKEIDKIKSNIKRRTLPKKYIELIESLEEDMMEAWNNEWGGNKGLPGMGNAIRIQSRAMYDGEKDNILSKTKWDKECDDFIKKMRDSIKKSKINP